MIEYQVLFQSGIGDIAPLGCILYSDVTVGLQHLHRFGILFLAPQARAAGQAVVQSQPLACPLAELQHFGIMRPQLTAEVRAAQSELTGYLRYVVVYIVHAVTRRDSLLVFGMGLRTLPLPLVHLYISGFLRTAPDAVAFQHQMPVVSIDIAGKSAERDFAPPAYIDSGKVGRGI